jgi:Uncharacterized protein conserved in bacteria, prophage-related
MTKISALREFRSGRTLGAAAKALGVDKTTLLRWEEGVVKIPHDRVLDVERVTGISRHELRPDLSRIFISTNSTPVEEQAS